MQHCSYLGCPLMSMPMSKKLNLIIEAQFAFISKISMNVENGSENNIRFEF